MDQDSQGLTIQEVLGSLLGGLGAGYGGYKLGKMYKGKKTQEAISRVNTGIRNPEWHRLVEGEYIPAGAEGKKRGLKEPREVKDKKREDELLEETLRRINEQQDAMISRLQKPNKYAPILGALGGGTLGTLSGYNVEHKSKDQTGTLASLLGMVGGAAAARKFLDPVPGALEKNKKFFAEYGATPTPKELEQVKRSLDKLYYGQNALQTAVGGSMGVPVGYAANFYLNPFYEKPEKKKKNGM